MAAAGTGAERAGGAPRRQGVPGRRAQLHEPDQHRAAARAPSTAPARAPASAARAPSPWPSMRHDRYNTAAGTIPTEYHGDRPWSFATGRGLFITPVIGGDGTVYFGSADHRFYALAGDGRLRWKFTTGNIIDAAAALD